MRPVTKDYSNWRTILVNSTALLSQWQEALEKFLTINESLPEEPKKRGRKKVRRLIGQLGGGKDTRGGIIDIALMQSLFESDEREVKPFVADYGMVIADECHHAAVLTSRLEGKVQNVILLIGSAGQKEKREVRIYDYVDACVPMLERMYHRRLRGCAELGYEVKLGGRDDAPCVIYTGTEFTEPFTADLTSAAREIVISSPYIQKNRVKSLLPVLTGVPTTAYTTPPESYKPEYQDAVAASIALMESSGVTVILRLGLTLRLTLIDSSLVWYGDINPLAFPARDADALRFDSADIAGELLDTLNGSGEQLRIEDL